MWRHGIVMTLSIILLWGRAGQGNRGEKWLIKNILLQAVVVSFQSP
jgi:hypothetical protein